MCFVHFDPGQVLLIAIHKLFSEPFTTALDIIGGVQINSHLEQGVFSWTLASQSNMMQNVLVCGH